MMSQQISVNKIGEKREKEIQAKLEAEREAARRAAAAAHKKKKKKKKPPVEGQPVESQKGQAPATDDAHKEAKKTPKKQPKEETTGANSEQSQTKKSDNTNQD